MATGMEDVEDLIDPAISMPSDIEPEMSDLLPRGYLSVSQAATFIKCPRQWALLYVEQKARRASARMLQGVFVHAAVEIVLKEILATGKLPPLSLATDSFSDAFEANKNLIDDWEDAQPGTVKDVGVECAKIFHQNAGPTSTPVSVETTFHVVIQSEDGKVRLPILGRIDSTQVQAHTDDEYQQIRQDLAAGRPSRKPLRIHDLKVSADKKNEADIENSLQFATYAHVEGIPDVQIDNLVKGRAKVPRPRYEKVTGIITPRQAKHALRVLEGAARSIALGHFPPTDPDNWWCSEKWCPVWGHCRGAG